VSPDFDLRAARLVAGASVASYLDDDHERAAVLAPLALHELGYVRGRGDSAAWVGETMAGEVLWIPRGTEFSLKTLPSIAANLDTRPVKLGGGPRIVMAGYDQQMLALWTLLREAPEPHWIGGHSMGGVIANLMAQLIVWHRAPSLCVTLGAPMHANLAFNEASTVPRLRIEREDDPAPRHPSEFSNLYEQPPGVWWLHAGTRVLCEHRPLLTALLFDWDQHACAKYQHDIEALTG
jgi:hypothetical protein